MRKAYAAAELTDGTTWDNVRVTLATKLQLERTMRSQRWTAKDNDVSMTAFMSWHAAKLAGLHNLSWEQFLERVVDATLEAEDGTPADGEELEVDMDPTTEAPRTS